jgi:hypothetical protein
MTTIVFDPAAFRANPLFAPFSNATTYSDAILNAWADAATGYISDQNGGCYVNGISLKQQTQAINLMVAHLLSLSTQIGNKPGAPKTPGLKQAATIDKVSVTLTPPPVKNQWQWWLSLTPYGQQLLALLQLASVGGFFFGAFPVAPSFRR